MSRIRYGNFLILFLVFMFCLGIYGCAGKASTTTTPPAKEAKAAEGVKAKSAGDTIATIGEDAITIEEYKEEMALLPPVYRAMASSNQQQFIDSLVNKHLLLAEAKKRHLENSENVKRLLEKAKDEIMMQELIGIEITDKIKVTSDEIDKYYQLNKEKYMEPAKTKAAHILVDSEVVAQKVLADLRSGADFAKEAQEYSLDAPTKDKGGETGYFAKGTLLPEFEEACDTLKTGETSGIVKTGLGYHVIKVIDRQEAQPRPLEDVKGDIENELFIEKQISLYDDLMKKLKEGKEIKINSAVLEKVTAK
ncbi:MAG: peptidyl-prolyl cis-trans isomerase [Candidatus Omnitrophica bacterium]|nr:peptidyl-prolyl cis-trans isomerase [Candidatus Omnitrophota bacterium]